MTVNRANLTMEIFEALYAKAKGPTVVYHYTGLQGLFGILRSQSIWCTDIRYLNDAEELVYAKTLCSDFLGARTANCGERLQSLHVCLLAALQRLMSERLFVASFSEVGDQLSQWRAYGKGSGVALGLGVSEMADLLKESGLKVLFNQCVYVREEQEAQISLLIDRLCRACAEEGVWINDAVATFVDVCSVLASTFKHPGFAEEREWRITVRDVGGEIASVPRAFRVGRETLVPYIDLPLCRDAAPFPLKTVVVGPNPSMALACAAVKEHVAACDHALVVPSSVPFRNW